MKFKIGFSASANDATQNTMTAEHKAVSTPRPSVVQVRFQGHGMPLAYYNDLFDLYVGDMVYVEGKMEGKRGTVTEVSYTFKIKKADYKRVITLVDTEVHGEFFLRGFPFRLL